MSVNYSAKYNIDGNPDTMKRLGVLRHTTNLNLQFYERQFLNNIYHRMDSYGLDTLITGYDIKGVNEIYNRLIDKKPIDLTQETEIYPSQFPSPYMEDLV